MSNIDNAFSFEPPFPPAGDQEKAITDLSEGLSTGLKYQTLLGVTGSGKTYTMAGVINRVQRPALILAPNKTLAIQLYTEMKSFFPHNAVEYFVSYYDYYQPEAYLPSADLYIEKDSAINKAIEQLRLSATKNILERKDVVIIASVSAIYGIGDPQEYQSMSLRFSVGDQLYLSDIIKQLVCMQYKRSEDAIERGHFLIQGDVLTVFPAEHFAHAIKVLFLEDEIEDIILFDPLTGEYIKRIKKFVLYPASHYVTRRETVLKAIDSIKEELKQRTLYFQKQGKPLEAERLTQRTLFDIEMLLEIGFCKGIENYSRCFSGRLPGEPPTTLMDYLPDNSIVFIDESHITYPQIQSMYRGDRSRKDNLIEFGFRLPSSRDNRPLKFEEFQEYGYQTIFVTATPAQHEKKLQQKIVEQVVRPTGLLDPEILVLPASSQVDDVVIKIQERKKNNERIIITVLTKRTAEKLADYLSDIGLQVRYLHSDIDMTERVSIIYDFRQGVFDVLIGINLLREGLDIPEVSLVAIFDADKEGFLRSESSLIQIIGRAARNSNGMVIFYGDVVTKSMLLAMNETNRRRDIQEAYNKVNNIKPKTIHKKIEMLSVIQSGHIRENDYIDKEYNIKSMSEDEINKLLNTLEKKMKTFSKNYEFQKAKEMRDLIIKISLIKS